MKLELSTDPTRIVVGGRFDCIYDTVQFPSATRDFGYYSENTSKILNPYLPCSEPAATAVLQC